MNSHQFVKSLIIITILLMISAGCQQEKELKISEQKIRVKTARVLQQSLSFPVMANGVLVSPSEMRLSFKTGGIIEQLYADEGQKIKKGQLLATLQMAEIEARFRQARSAFEKAMRDFERVNNLYQDSVATLEQKQDAETGLAIAKSNLEIAEFNLKHSSIIAPGNGKILKRLAEKNELVEAGRPIFLFGSTEGGWVVRTGISEQDIVKINYEDSAEVSFDAYPEEKFKAVVTQIAQAADPYTGTYEVELTLLPHHHKLIFGFVAQIRIFPRVKENYYMIPIEALTEADGRRGIVFYPQSSPPIAKKAEVEIAHILDKQLAIRNGLENITEVITEGSPYLREGSVLEIVK